MIQRFRENVVKKFAVNIIGRRFNSLNENNNRDILSGYYKTSVHIVHIVGTRMQGLHYWWYNISRYNHLCTNGTTNIWYMMAMMRYIHLLSSSHTIRKSKNVLDPRILGRSYKTVYDQPFSSAAQRQCERISRKQHQDQLQQYDATRGYHMVQHCPTQPHNGRGCTSRGTLYQTASATHSCYRVSDAVR